MFFFQKSISDFFVSLTIYQVSKLHCLRLKYLSKFIWNTREDKESVQIVMQLVRRFLLQSRFGVLFVQRGSPSASSVFFFLASSEAVAAEEIDFVFFSFEFLSNAKIL